MTTYASHLRAEVPQSEPLPGQVPNSAGGHAFAVDKWTRLDRFLILGSEGGSYYAGERKLTLDNVDAVKACIAEDGTRAVDAIAQVSHDGRAPKNDPALLALALAFKHGDAATRAHAGRALPLVARIGTHLFHMAEYLKALGVGWGRGTARAFANWYESMAPDKLALQAVKYQSRDGWAHRDLLRKSHPKALPASTRPASEAATRAALFDWMCRGWESVGVEPHPDEVLRKIWAFERAKTAKGKELVKLISDYGLPHECVPNEAKGDPATWAAMLPSMGLTALVRNLGKMTSVGLLKPMSAEAKFVAEKLTDVDALRGARVHPLALLVAQKTYAQGHGDKGSLTWAPVTRVVDALDEAFYLAFKAVEPTGKRHLLALDISGSMGSGLIAGMPLTPREGSAAMALVTANVETEHHFYGFSDRFVPLAISPRQRLTDAIQAISNLPFQGTDCALPMRYALDQKIPVDVFCVYTDNETWAGDMHPTVALERYRQKMGIGAKLVVIGMVSNGFSIADPNDRGMLDVCGFDTATPAVLADFARG